MEDFSLKKGLSPLNWSLMLSGTWIYAPANRLIRILVYVHRLLLFCALFVAPFLTIRHMTYNTIGLTFAFRYILKNLFNFLFITTVLSKNGFIREVLHNLQPLITQQDAKNLFRFLFFCFFYQILRFAISLTRYVHVFIIYGLHLSQLHLLHPIYCYISSWTINSVVLFATIVKVLYFAERSLLRQVIENIQNISPEKVYLRVKAFVEIKNEILQKISILILFNFIFIFVESVVAVVSHIENQQKGVVEVTASITVIVNHVLTIVDITLLVSLTTKLCHQSKRNYEDLETKIVLTQDTNKWNFVLDKIKIAQHFEYQAFDCFPINKQILSAFTASLITFTVLFAQLVSPDKC